MQQELWQQGRDINGKIIDPKKIVTDAPPGHSWHQYGLCVDVAPFNLEGQPIWDIKDPAWKAITAIAPQFKLLSGACFSDLVDMPHWQAIEIPESPTDEDRLIFREVGMIGVWKEYGLEED